MKSTTFYLIFTSLLLYFSHVSAQKEIKIYAEETKEGFRIYADNPEFCPITIRVDFGLNNMKSEAGEHPSFLLKEKSSKTLLTTVSIINKYKASKFVYTYTVSLGDDKQTEYDVDYDYFLPFEKGNSFGLHQGYNGTFSHQNENSLDFKMPVDTPITAIRDGIVIKLVENNILVCPKLECAQYNNYVIIYHSDGTFAEYTHINRNGVLVNVGDKVTKGQVIASSGNTGFSSGPHLHLMVYLQRLKTRETIPTKFKIGDGTTTEFLKEGEIYSRDY